MPYISPLHGHPLSPRQLECIALASQGLENTEIAARLHISKNTVETHLKRANHQAGTRNRAHLVAVALGAGLIPKVAAGHPEAVAA